MPILANSTYRARGLFRWNHMNTVYPTLFRRLRPVPFITQELKLPDSDFLELDRLSQGADRCLLLCHGLEGSSASKYIQSMARYFFEHGFDVCAMNYRSCGKKMNRKARFYHSGATEDFHEVIKFLHKLYSRIDIAGFSLGGNLVLKYLGDGNYLVPKKIHKVVAIAAPVELFGASKELHSAKNFIYHKRFLLSLKDKIIKKRHLLPPALAGFDLGRIKTLREFDDVFTGPLHGFKDASDYYHQASSLADLTKIRIPTLLINSLDDSFLSKSCYPFDAARENNFLTLETPRYGGHLGFSQLQPMPYWQDMRALYFLSD